MMLGGPPDMLLRSVAPLVLLVASLPACKRASPPPAVSLDVVPSARFSPEKPHAGQPLAVTYRWQVGPRLAAMTPHMAFVHFVAADGTVLFTDDHTPMPPPEAWEPGGIYEYTRLAFTYHQFPGPLQVRLGLYDPQTGVRVGLAAEHAGQAAYRVGLLNVIRRSSRQTVLFHSGFSPPWTTDKQPLDSFRWMGREAVVACANPRSAAVLFLRGSTNLAAFAAPPTLRISVGGFSRSYAIESERPFTLAVPMSREALGTEELTDVTLAMSHTFAPPGGGSPLGLTVERVVLLPEAEVAGEILSAAIVL
jgi:hypothetical protein